MSTGISRADGQSLLRMLEKEGDRNVYSCYQCGKCTAACPFSFTPHRVMRYLQLGRIDRALTTETTWACASCLACSRVCPKGADPARIMKELRSLASGSTAGVPPETAALAAEQYRRHNHRLRSFFFANIHDISRRGSRFAPLSNWLAKMPGSKLVAHHLLGIHRERALPEFVRPSFPDWFRARRPLGNGRRSEVFLFHDTFMDYDAPQIGVAATELLELSGYRVTLSDSVCCGRPMISKGYLSRAREKARINVDRLHRQVQEGCSLVGCEPSCLLTIREEYPRLLAGSDRERQAKEVADRCLLIDEFLCGQERDGGLELPFGAGNGREVLFHGHCQQKAGADPSLSVELLAKAGFKAEMVATPCCGMAGAFGFEKEHYEASKSAFHRALGPAVASRPEAQLAIMGISCRKQIQQFAGRTPRHLVELLREACEAGEGCGPCSG